MAYDNLKLEKGLYTTGKSFTQALEQIDPSENYAGTPLEGLDAYQRQLKRFDIKVSGIGSDTVSKFFQTSDSAALFPEYVSRAVRQGMEQADVLLVNGGGMESFLTQAIAQYPDLRIVDTSEGIELLETEHHHHEEEAAEEHEEHAHEHEHEGNPHIWLSPARAAEQAQNICDALSELDAAEQELFAENTAAFRAQTDELLAEAATVGIPDGEFAAIFHEGFAYLTELFGMQSAVEIFADEYQEPSAKELAFAAEEAQEHGIRYFLSADDDGKKYAAVLAAEGGQESITLDPLTMAQGDADSYAERMQRNIDAIRAYGGR